MNPTIITVNEFNKFNCISYRNPSAPSVQLAFKMGYWNCFVRTPELEAFLKDNQIDYTLNTYSDMY